jgi:hypothetical protein
MILFNNLKDRVGTAREEARAFAALFCWLDAQDDQVPRTGFQLPPRPW